MPRATSADVRVDVACAGEALWDLTAASGRSFTKAASLALDVGGGALNVALALAKSRLLIGAAIRAGDDALGRALVARVEAAGVRVSAAPSTRTGLMFIDASAGSFVGYRGDDDALAPIPFDSRWLHLSGITPNNVGAFAKALRAARRHGATISIDANARPRFWRGATGEDRAGALALLREADVLQASRADLLGLAISTEELFGSRKKRSVMVVTASSEPTRVAGPFGELAAKVGKRSDKPALGAGDACAAAIIATLFDANRDDARAWEIAIRNGHAAARARLGLNRRP